ncbi:MFS transporter [Roseicyclus sp. F158]|uniref:MFS transporter n=1 Tax=Tropicimonas omnivorans TaxID=3075590 RepID=A0ABU3DBX3_9RHOB|nr:MFS transporter [Roseicyclus sp. F158]MDT0681211.1 MFS transporter [Roseicyclus sp. F158]
MAEPSLRKRIWGWFFFDWASQPYNTLLLTFIFGPYVTEVLGDGSTAQTVWAIGIGIAGLVIALLAPILGSMADTSGRRMPWIWGFSALYVIGAAGLWWAAPSDFDLIRTLIFFALGLIGMEFATIFTNSMLPDLGSRAEIGRISGNGWAFGYCGGLIALLIMLAFFAQGGDGKTFLGLDPAFGLDPETREGTRAVGPLTAIWYAVFMVPFFLWVRDARTAPAPPGSTKLALRELGRSIRDLPKTPSLAAYLASSMFYRDALNAMYGIGGVYAAGVLGWAPTDSGIFGVVAIITGAVFAFLGGQLDSRFGPKPVITICIWALLGVSVCLVAISRDSMFGIPLGEGSKAPDIAFYVMGAVIGAAGGVLQAASRTMMVRQGNPHRMTQSFGLYALAGKATSFVAPLLIGAVTFLSGSQQIGISPLIALFLLGLFLLRWVNPHGEREDTWAPSAPSSPPLL